MLSLDVQIFDHQTLDAQTFKQVIRARGWRTFYHRTFNFFKRIWQFCAGSLWAVRRNWKIQFEMFWISSSSLLLLMKQSPWQPLWPFAMFDKTPSVSVCPNGKQRDGKRLTKFCNSLFCINHLKSRSLKIVLSKKTILLADIWSPRNLNFLLRASHSEFLAKSFSELLSQKLLSSNLHRTP